MKIAVIGLTGRMSGAVIEEITKHSDCQLSGIFPEEKILHEWFFRQQRAKTFPK